MAVQGARDAFLRAAYSNDIDLMRLFLAYGADPMITAVDKTTPLMAAAGVGWLSGLVYTRDENLVETLELCLELGNDVNAVNEGVQWQSWQSNINPVSMSNIN